MWDTISTQLQQLAASLTQPVQALAAGSTVVASVSMVVSTVVKTMIPVGWLAVGSRLGFIIYSLLRPKLMMALLHAVLLPVHLWRLRQTVWLTCHLSTHADPQQMQIWLRPYMRSAKMAAGSHVFDQGAQASRMVLLADGVIDLPEVGQQLHAGEMFGEIALFAANGRRTSSAICRSDCTVMSIDEDPFKQLVMQNPEFGLEVVRLIAQRLGQDVQRLQAQAGAWPR
jgi:CRP/FNR family transcriptional regulator, cyclic AMP receptor protein